MIKLFATDLDGTLLDHDGHIADEDVAALRRAREMGVTVVIATGRMPTIIDPILERLEVQPHEPVVGAQGSMITRRNGELLHSLTLAEELVHTAAAIAREFGAVPVFYTATDILMERMAFSVERDAFWLGDALRYDPNALDNISGELIKLLAVHPDPTAIDALLPAMQTAMGQQADVVRSHHWFVEAVNRRANKGAAIAWIAERLGIRQHEVLAIGDAGNDVSMLRWAGHSAAPANAAPDARAVADWLAPTLQEHAVAATLAHFLKI